MIKMSFYNGTLDRAALVDFIKTTTKPIRYTYGFAYRHPSTYKELISVDKAIKIAETESFLDATENEEYLHLNAYSANDMW